jgi:hypothetical protein
MSDSATWYAMQTRARLIVSKAVQLGLMPKVRTLTCTDCGRPATGYDHRDYRKPLDVEPVCHGCNVYRGSALPVEEADVDNLIAWRKQWVSDRNGKRSKVAA